MIFVIGDQLPLCLFKTSFQSVSFNNEENLSFRRMGGRELSISVVIAWVNPLELLVPGLEVLVRQQSRSPDEVIIATRHNEEACMRLRALYPGMIVLTACRTAPITALRSMGIRAARGTVIVVTEDHCVPSRDWIRIVEQRMRERDCAVVGGPVENAFTSRLRDWAAFLTEYADFIAPTGSHKTTQAVPGNNAAYRRELCDDLCATLDRGRWESFRLQELLQEGVRVVFDPQMLIHHSRSFDFWYFVGQRYHFCRSFAAMRGYSFTLEDRFKYGLGSLLLPPLLWLRGFLTLMRKRRLVGRYLVCSPLIAIYMIVGAFGEMVGYLLGGGDSLVRVE